MATIDRLFNTSWTAHRLSPLHHGKEFSGGIADPRALHVYASRLRDQLTGDTAAAVGLQPGAVALTGSGDDVLSKLGALKDCTWELLPQWPQLDDITGPRSAQDSAGILITLRYESIAYEAALLADISPNKSSEASEESAWFPLLLTRLPNSLRSIFVSFLSSNFDVYCSILRFPQDFLCAALLRYFTAFTVSGPLDTHILGDIIGEMQLTLSFSGSVSPQLRSLNISIPRNSLDSFLSVPLSSNLSPERNSALLVNLSLYFRKHLAMDLNLDPQSGPLPGSAEQHVRLSKIACAAFVIGADGRLKLALSRVEAATNDDAADTETEARSERERRILRSNTALLHAVIDRAATGQRRLPKP